MSNFCGLLEENLIFLLDAASATSLLFSPVSILDRTSFVGDDPEMVTDFFLRLRPFLCGGGGGGASWSDSVKVTGPAAVTLVLVASCEQ